MCEITRETPAPLADLIAILPKPADFARKESGYTYYDGLDEAVEKTMPALREAANNCPACIFAALRQSGVYCQTVAFDFKEECKSFWDDVNADHEECRGFQATIPTDEDSRLFR
jgi:hypothetical protein